MLKRVLVNTLPKNGTHLLLQVLSHVPGYRPSSIEVDWQNVGRAFELLPETRPGQFSKGHLPCLNDIPALIERENLTLFSMIRDPRDNVVSFYHYIMSQPAHRLYPSYSRMANDDERLMATITGFRDDHEGREIIHEGIGWRSNAWGGWNDKPYCCPVVFERLIGPQGGGSRREQLRELHRILEHLDIAPEDTVLEDIADHAYNTGTHSFRKGRIGDWVNHFKEEHKRVFKSEANRFLVQYGYEDSDNW